MLTGSVFLRSVDTTVKLLSRIAALGNSATACYCYWCSVVCVSDCVCFGHTGQPCKKPEPISWALELGWAQETMY